MICIYNRKAQTTSLAALEDAECEDESEEEKEREDYNTMDDMYSKMVY